MFQILKKLINKPTKTRHLDQVSLNEEINPVHNQLWNDDLSDEHRKLISQIIDQNLSMTSFSNLSATVHACQYVLRYEIEGDFMECGVWRGGHSILAAKILFNTRRIFLLDTFSGMSLPDSEDIRISDGRSASSTYDSKHVTENGIDWCLATLEDVKQNFFIHGLDTNILDKDIIFLKGKAEELLVSKNTNLPQKISVLRLDTDWYQSTKVELEVLWDRVPKGGIIIIDDYGYWQGCRKAVEEFFVNKPIFLCPIDTCARIAVKL